MKVKQLFAVVLGLSLSVFASAQDAQVFKIGGGGGAKNGSVYSSVVATLAEKCSTDAVTVQEVGSKGGTENFELLRGNKVKAALIPTDVLLNAQYENASSVSQLKTLVTLHREAAHLIARGDTKQEGGFNVGFTTLGGNKVTFNTAEDLKGRHIGVVGGSAVTAMIISNQLKYQWQLDNFNSTAEMLAALTAGKIDAVLISAGLQSDAVKSIKGNFKLLPIRGNSDSEKVYKSVKVEYSNLNNGRAVDTLAARALLMTRIFRSDDAVKVLADLRACFLRELPKIQDSDGVHPAWLDMDPEDRGPDGFWYSLPGGKAPEAAKPAKRK